jgi:glycine betaine/proline transport system ATP-binding protein
MRPLDMFRAQGGVVPSDAPVVTGTETLSNLIRLAIEDDKPILVKRDDTEVGVITRADLLRTVVEGTEMS